MSTSPVTYPPGSAAKTKNCFDRAKADEDDDLDTMEKNLSDYQGCLALELRKSYR